MGSQQGDDLQLNGDLACENAEIRGELRVHGAPVTAGLTVENAGAPIAGGPFVAIDLPAVGGLVGINGGGGVARIRTTSPMPLDALGGDPGPQAGKVIAYSKVVAGVTQYFIQSSDGTVHQVTPATSPPVVVSHDGSLEGDGGATPLATVPGGLNGATTVVGVVKPSTQTIRFTDFVDTAGVTFDVSAGCVGDLEAGNPLAWPNLGLGTLFVNAAAGVHARVYPSPGTASPKPIALDSAGVTRALFQTKIQMTSPPNAGADYRLCAGWSGNSSPNGSGLFFQTGFNALGNGNFWATVNCGPSGDPNPVDTGIAVDGNPHTLTIDYQPLITSAFFYIDGALVATFVSVPSPFNFTGVYSYFVGLDYTAPLGVRGAQQMWIDWLYFRGDATR